MYNLFKWMKAVDLEKKRKKKNVAAEVIECSAR